MYDNPRVQAAFVREHGDHLRASLILEGIRCSACLWLNEQHLRKLDGIVDVEIDATSHQARVTWDPARLKLSQILAAITDIGFSAHPYDPARREQMLEQQKTRSLERLIFAGLLMMPVVSFQIASYWIGGPGADGTYPLFQTLGRWFMLAVVTIILAYSGQDFFRGAWRDLRHRQLGMDVPVVLGLGIAWAASAVSTFRGRGDTYFDSIAMFVFLVLLARIWELRGRLKSAAALDRALKILPRTARRLAPDGTEEEVLAVDLGPGDILRLLPGENAPTDGRLRSAAASFDESLLTGESLPVLRHAGDAVIGGACNVDQPVEIEVTRPADASTMMEIHDLIARGLTQRPRFAQIADRIAPWFVATVLAVAAATYLFWLLVDPTRATPALIAVLIVTCPCALALATPVALSIAAGRFARMNILPMRMSALEPMADADLMVFDKTGTLTMGQPELAATLAMPPLDDARALALAAAIDARSEHPFGRALLAQATRRALPVPAALVARNFPGQGMQAEVGTARWRLGTEAFALADRPPLPPDAVRWRDSQVAAGRSVIVLADDSDAVALFAFEDRLRNGTRDSLGALRQAGLSLAILSGDSPAAVTRLARELGIDDAHGAMKPADKLNWLRARQGEGHRVLMVGDGINDAPVLTAADAAISFSGATDLARQASDFVILGSDFKALPGLVRLGRATTRIITQNLAWAAGYNLLAVPAAAAGYIPPWAAAIGMSISSLVVVSNALRLRRMRVAS